MTRTNLSRLSAVGVAMILGATVLTACSGSGTSGSATPTTSQSKGSIVFVVNRTTDPFYIAMFDGAKVRGDELGYDVTWQGPAEQSAANQTTLLQQVAATKPDAIIFSAADAEALAAPLKEVLNSGIPVAVVDSDVSDASARLWKVATDNTLVGTAAADEANRLLNGEGKVGHVGYTPGVQTVDDRASGWREQLTNYPGLVDVGDQYAELDISENQQKAAGLIAREPDLQAIFTDWEGACLGAAQAVKQAGKTGEIQVLCADGNPDQINALKAGEVAALFIQKPKQMGATVIEQMADYLETGNDQEDVAMDVVTVNTDNVDDPATQEYFYGTE